MKKIQKQELKERLKNEDFLALHRELSAIYGVLAINGKIGGYIPSLDQPGRATRGAFLYIGPLNLAKAMHSKAESIAYQLALFFPRDKRFAWEQRFICFALTGDYDGTKPPSKAGRPSGLTQYVKDLREDSKPYEEKGLNDQQIANRLGKATTADIIRYARMAEKKAGM